jgi:hypothetical protein
VKRKKTRPSMIARLLGGGSYHPHPVVQSTSKKKQKNANLLQFHANNVRPWVINDSDQVRKENGHMPPAQNWVERKTSRQPKRWFVHAKSPSQRWRQKKNCTRGKKEVVQPVTEPSTRASTCFFRLASSWSRLTTLSVKALTVSSRFWM